MSAGHTGWEVKLLVDAVGLLLLHRDCIVLGLGVLLGVSLVHGDLTDDLFTEFLEDCLEEKTNVLS